MTYSVLPPEINSARMFSGAGSAPMLDAAGAWDSLAAELGSAASSFSSLTSGLTSQAWQGPASAAMVAAAAPYAGWLSAAEAQAAGAAGQARAVAGAFESALGATVHPLAVAANRNGLVQLVETNLFGQNAPAIAAVESDYEQMWAQDVAAMAGYHAGASAAATGLSPWQTLQQELELTLNAAVSVDGFTLLQSGSASAFSDTGDLAIAVGRGTVAFAGSGIGNLAAAFGPLDTAYAGNPIPVAPPILNPFSPQPALSIIEPPRNANLAVVLGSSSHVSALGGNFDLAAVVGNFSTAEAQGGLSIDVALGDAAGGSA